MCVCVCLCVCVKVRGTNSERMPLFRMYSPVCVCVCVCVYTGERHELRAYATLPHGCPGTKKKVNRFITTKEIRKCGPSVYSDKPGHGRAQGAASRPQVYQRCGFTALLGL